MMVKITTRCTMGCKHCISDCKPDGVDMTRDTLIQCLDFLKRNGMGRMILISGGEPLEHSDFETMILDILNWNTEHQNHIVAIIVTTNGEKIQDDEDTYVNLIKVCKSKGVSLMYQISADRRFYPRRINTTKHVFRTDGFMLVDDCVEQVYPQGRARDNDLPWQSKAPKCYNARAIARQIQGCDLSEIEAVLASSMKFCTPHISVHGELKLGESDLCPPFATVNEDMRSIMRKLRRFQCDGCKMIMDKLPENYRKVLE